MRLAIPSGTTPAFRVLCCSLLVVATACRGGAGPAGGGPQVQRETRGDTTVVRTLSGSVWGDSVQVTEELAIGQLDGPPEYQFGSIQALTVDSAGGVYVFDGNNRVLNFYAADGHYVRTVGREGQGPGEYGNTVLGMAVRHGDGRLLVYDVRNGRIDVFNPDGSYSDQWHVNSGLFTSNALVVDTADNVYVKVLAGKIEPNQPWPIAFMHLNANGEIVDTLRPPTIAGEPTDGGGRFVPSKVWGWSPLGYFVAGVSDTYAFALYHGGGQITRIERALEPVAVEPGEKSEWEAVNAWTKKYQGRFMTTGIPAIPDEKPPYKSFMFGDHGRIWVSRYMPAEKGEASEARLPDNVPGANEYPAITWHEPNVMDVFQPDGTYLGAVKIPAHVNIMFIRGDALWGVRRGDMDEPYIVRLRVRAR